MRGYRTGDLTINDAVDGTRSDMGGVRRAVWGVVAGKPSGIKHLLDQDIGGVRLGVGDEEAIATDRVFFRRARTRQYFALSGQRSRSWTIRRIFV